MPNYKGHLMGGVAAYSLMFAIFPLSLHPYATLTEWGMCTLLGALFPDIDTKSKGQKLFYSALFIALLILFINQKWYTAALIAPLALIPLLVNHRGIFHAFWFIVLLVGISASVAITTFPWARTRIIYDALFFLLGAFSHLVLDKGLRKTLGL